MLSNGFQNTKRADAVDVRSLYRPGPGTGSKALRAQIVEFTRLQLVDCPIQRILVS